jgi:hypothetical protein
MFIKEAPSYELYSITELYVGNGGNKYRKLRSTDMEGVAYRVIFIRNFMSNKLKEYFQNNTSV